MPRTGRPPVYRDRAAEMFTYFEQGHSLIETAERFGCSVLTVRRWLYGMSYLSGESRVAPAHKRRRFAVGPDGFHVCREAADNFLGYYDLRALRPVEGDVIALASRGVTARELAERFGTREATIVRLLNARTAGHRYCPACDRLRPIAEWHTGMPGKFQAACRECVTASQRARYDPERERGYAQKRKPARNALSRRQRRGLRDQIIEGYGGRCVCCGESERTFLAIDHVNGGGKQDRARFAGRGGSNAYYRSIIDSGFPDTLRLLCHNCNAAMGLYGFCPHAGRPEPPDISGWPKAKKENYWRTIVHKNLRRQTLEAYGGVCACCGAPEYEFLSLDHIDGGGRQEHLARKAKGISPMQWYRQLRRDGYPPGLRVLCHNCNLGRSLCGTCPHGNV